MFIATHCSFARALRASAAALLCALPAICSVLTVTSTGDSGPGTLRDTVAAAASGDTIVFQLPNPSTIFLTSGFVRISKNLTIVGPGPGRLAIDGSQLLLGFVNQQGWNGIEVFLIDTGAVVSMSGFTIQNGFSTVISFGQSLTVSNVAFVNNHDSGTALGLPPCDIWNRGGLLTVANSAVQQDWSLGFSCGAAFRNSGGVMSVTKTSLAGAGIWNDYGTATVSESAVSGTLTQILNSGTLSVVNSTLTGAIIGGLSGHTNVVNTTVSDNSSAAIVSFGPGSLSIKGVLLARNSGGNCRIDTQAGPILSGGYNLSDDASCAGSLTASTDTNGAPAGLDSAPKNNGGPTPTVALLAGSPAVDAIPAANCTDLDGVTPIFNDQRGFPRPAGAGCDIGAYEAGALFASISATLKTSGPATAGQFLLIGTFALNALSNGINPAAEPVSVRAGSYAVTLAPGSFRGIGGGWVYYGTVNKVALAIVIAPLSGGRYQFMAAGTGVNLATLSAPATASLLIGDDGGTAATTP